MPTYVPWGFIIVCSLISIPWVIYKAFKGDL